MNTRCQMIGDTVFAEYVLMLKAACSATTDLVAEEFASGQMLHLHSELRMAPLYLYVH